MKKKDAIKDFIHSLTMNEKRYFKIYNAFYDKGNTYTDLFDAIDKNEGDFEKNLKIKYLRVAKNRLHQQILKSLRSFNSGKSPTLTLRELADHIEILEKKGLNYQALGVIEKAKKIATDFEIFTSLIELLLAEQRLYVALQDTSWIKKNITESHSHILATTEKLENFNKFILLENEIVSLALLVGKAGNEKARSAYKKIASNKLFSDKKQPLSIRSSLIQCYIQGMYYMYAERNAEKSLNAFMQFKKIVDSNSHFFQTYSKRYIYNIGSILSNIVLLPNQSFEKVREYLNFYKNIPYQTSLTEEEIMVRYYAGLTDIHMNFGKHQACENYFNEIEAWINGLNDPQKIKFRLLQLYFNLGTLYFVIGKYHKALHWFSRVINEQDVVAKNIVVFSKLFQLLIYYETEEIFLLNSIANSTIRLLKKINFYNELEKNFIYFIQRTSSKKDFIPNKEKYFLELKEKLTSIVKNNPLEAKSLEYLDCISWVESKIQNKKLVEIVSNKAIEQRKLL